uniref:Uncharacterized protein n=1 Tax=Acrobeloides nanus TaxID=290746 RepID=A0A914E5A5_9BILA
MLSKECPDFITRDERPPNLNPLNYEVWSILMDKACAKPHPSVESFDQSLDEITFETLEKIVDNFPKRMKACVEAKGGHF